GGAADAGTETTGAGAAGVSWEQSPKRARGSRGADHGFEPPGFGRDDATAEVGQPVVPPPLIVVFGRRAFGFDSQALGKQPLKNAVKRAGGQLDFAAGPFGHV